MKKYFCDKCGKEMTQEQYERPYFYITKYDIIEGNHYQNYVVLCEECESKLIKWLGETE